MEPEEIAKQNEESKSGNRRTHKTGKNLELAKLEQAIIIHNKYPFGKTEGNRLHRRGRTLVGNLQCPQRFY
jgi:hypothetical protein